MQLLWIRWLLTLWISLFFVSAHSAGQLFLPMPTVVSDALDKDLEISELMKSARELWGNEKWNEAASQWEAIFPRVNEKYGSNHILTEIAGAYLGDCLRGRSDFKLALPLLERAAISFDRLFGSDQLPTAWVLGGLAATYRGLGQGDLALPLDQRALGIREKELGPEHPDTAQSLHGLATNYIQFGEYERALPILLRALSIREKTLGPTHQKTAQNLSNLAVIYGSLAQFDKAVELYQRALAISELNLGLDHMDVATVMSNLAATYDSLAQFDKAVELYQQALAISERVSGSTHPDTANYLNNLATTLIQLGQYEKALELYRRALQILEKSRGREHLDIANVTSNMALIYRVSGQYEQAIENGQRALAILEGVFGPEHPNTARTLNVLASIYSELGQNEKALQFSQRALSTIEANRGIDHPETAQALVQLASTFVSLGQHVQALPLNLRALAIFQKSFDFDHPNTARASVELAKTYFYLGDYENAKTNWERSLLVIEKNFGPEHPEAARVRYNLSTIHIKFARYEEALKQAQRALGIVEKTYGRDNRLKVSILHNMAFIFAKAGQPGLSISIFKLVVNMRQSERDQVSRIGATELNSFTQSVSVSYSALALLLTEQGRLPEAQMVLDMLKEDEQFEFIRRSETADSRRTQIGYNATEKAWVERYRVVSSRLAALGVEEQALQKQAKIGLSAEQKQRKQVLASDLRVAQKAFDAFLHEMRVSFALSGPARAADIADLNVEAVSELQTLIKGLGHDAVLLQYYVTDDQVGMLLTTPGVQLARSVKVSAKELNRQIADFRRLLRDPKSNLLPASQALYQLLVAPVAKDLEQAGAKTVMLSLDGALRYLPFGALHDGQRYLVQRWNLPMYTSVTKNRLRDAVTPQWQVAGLGVTRAIGEFAALPAIKTEMNSIVKAAGGGVLPGEVHLDEAFTAVRLKDVSQRSFQLLHVASHFRFSPGTEVNSFLLLGDGQELTLGDIRTQNYRFDNVDLLTLSACDTGLGGGRDSQGREIEGFGVIAQKQGAKAVLATLWPVADQSTAMLMAEMYRRRQEQQLTKTEALRQAQLSLLSRTRYAHPFYWAPFILMGNWL